MRSYSGSVSTQMCEKFCGDLVAQDALDEVQIVIDQRRRLAALGALLDLGPEVDQEAQVGAQILFAGARSGGAHDEAAGAVRVLGQNDPLQALALFVAKRSCATRRRGSPSA